jgi:hypothetical protein
MKPQPEKIKQIEKILGVKVDGLWDDKDQTALDKITSPSKARPTPPPPNQTSGSPVDPAMLANAAPTTYT